MRPPAKLADLANGFANNECGRPRISLDSTVVFNPCDEAQPTTTD
jgi:hypothetical protein